MCFILKHQIVVALTLTDTTVSHMDRLPYVMLFKRCLFCHLEPIQDSIGSALSGRLIAEIARLHAHVEV